VRLGILTGGGDVPGLNACIKAAVLRAADEGQEVLGIRRGWAGLVEFNPDDATTWARCVMPLDAQKVRTIDRTGGTILHSSRTNPAAVPTRDLPAFLRGRVPSTAGGGFDATAHVVRVVRHLGLDALIPIGGDDTLSYAERINREGVAVVAIPKTIDNDVFGTDYCIGFSTAVTRSVQYIHQLRSSVGSHERIALVELFGRNSGETSLLAAYLAGVDRAIISEVPFEPERLATFLLADKAANPSNYAMATISEGATMSGAAVLERGDPDAYGHRKLGGIGFETGEALKRLTGEDVLYQPLSYLMRSGAPDSLDLMVAVNYANIALSLVNQRAASRMVALRNGTYTSVPLQTIREGIKRTDVDELYDVDEYRPKVRHVDGKPMFLY
jgi:6-phosphofructokinase 1